MRAKSLIVGLVFCLILPAFSPADKNYNQTAHIQWSSKMRLGYDNFLGEPNVPDLAALTSSGIEVKYAISKKELKTTVVANFYPKNSWIRKSAKNAYVLQHEQLHFDITEWHARILRKNLSTVHPGNIEEEKLTGLINNSLQEWQDTQALYDKETDHGLNKSIQKYWEEKITTGLLETTDFALKN